MKRFLPLIIFGVLCVILVIGLQLNPKEIPSPLIGKSAPQFKLPVLPRANAGQGMVVKCLGFLVCFL